MTIPTKRDSSKRITFECHVHLQESSNVQESSKNQQSMGFGPCSTFERAMLRVLHSFPGATHFVFYTPPALHKNDLGPLARVHRMCPSLFGNIAMFLPNNYLESP